MKLDSPRVSITIYKDKMSNTEDLNQLNEEQQQVEMSLKQWLQVIEGNREEVLAQILKIEGEREMDVDEEMQMKDIISTNPVVENLMKIAEEEMGKWKETLGISKTFLALLFSLYSGPVDHSVLSVSYGVDHDPCHEVMQVIGVIQQYEAQAAKVMDGWINYHLNREQLKGGLLALLEHPDLLVNSDLHAAFNLLDKKMILEIKSDLSDLLINYSVLIDVLVAATAHLHDDEEDEYDMYV